MSSKSWVTILMCIILAAAAGCSDSGSDQRQALLAAQLNDAVAQYGADNQALAARESHLASLVADLEGLRARHTQYSGQVKSYMQDHQFAVAAIVLGVAGSEVALSDDNEFSTDAREMGAVVGTMAAIYAVTHADEVLEVLAELTKADSTLKQMEQQEQQFAVALAADRDALRLDQARAESSSQRLQMIRTSLASL